MKQIVTILKPYVAEKVVSALSEIPFDGPCLVREVKGYGRQKNYLDHYQGNEFLMAYLPKVLLQFWIDDSYVDQALQTIITHARTGRIGDGKIFVLSGFPISF